MLLLFIISTKISDQIDTIYIPQKIIYKYILFYKTHY